MTSWITLPIPATPSTRPKDEAVPRLARCTEILERLLALAETLPPEDGAELVALITKTAALEPGTLRASAFEALSRRYP